MWMENNNNYNYYKVIIKNNNLCHTGGQNCNSNLILPRARETKKSNGQYVLGVQKTSPSSGLVIKDSVSELLNQLNKAINPCNAGGPLQEFIFRTEILEFENCLVSSGGHSGLPSEDVIFA